MSPWTLLSDQTRRSCSTCEDRRSSSMGRVSTGPVSRSARANPRVRNALSRHSTRGCRCAPRPGSRPSVSRTRTDPRSSLLATMRARSDAESRCRHPTQVRTGCFRTADGVERTGAAGSDTALERDALDPKTETARLTSPQCSRTAGCSAAPACPECPVQLPGKASAVMPVAPRSSSQADTSVSVPVRPTPPCLCLSGRHLRVCACQADTSVSGRMSMRQPVRRAASRAFWPSLPIASDNW